MKHISRTSTGNPGEIAREEVEEAVAQEAEEEEEEGKEDSRTASRRLVVLEFRFAAVTATTADWSSSFHGNASHHSRCRGHGGATDESGCVMTTSGAPGSGEIRRRSEVR